MIDAPPPQYRQDNKDASVRRIDLAEGAKLLDGWQCPLSGPPGPLVTEPLPDHIAAADLHQARQDEQCPRKNHATLPPLAAGQTLLELSGQLRWNTHVCHHPPGPSWLSATSGGAI